MSPDTNQAAPNETGERRVERVDQHQVESNPDNIVKRSAAPGGMLKRGGGRGRGRAGRPDEHQVKSHSDYIVKRSVAPGGMLKGGGGRGRGRGKGCEV